MTFSRIKFLFIPVIFFAVQAFAGNDFDVTKNHTLIKVSKRGLETTTISLEYLVKTEAGRLTLTNYRMPFNGKPEHFKLLEAFSVTQGQKTVTQPQEVKITELQNNQLALTDSKQAIIPVKNVNIGSTVTVTYSVESPPTISGHFMSTYSFAYTDVVPDLKYEFDFDLPVNYVTDTIKENFDLKETAKPDGGKLLELVRKSNPEKKSRYGFIYFSSVKSWLAINKLLFAKYKAVWSGPLPPELESIVTQAQKLKTVPEQIDFAAAKINELVAYSGTWTTVSNKFLPQNFKDLVAKKSGDCKDFSTMLTAILNRLSIEAYPALVASELSTAVGTPSFKVRHDIPNLTVFDHLMVFAQDKSGQKWWVDPTQPLVNAKFITRGLVGKSALVLDGKTDGVMDLPQQLAMPEDIRIDQKLKVNGQMLEAQGTVSVNDFSRYALALSEKQKGAKAPEGLISSIINYKTKLPIVFSKTDKNDGYYNFSYVLGNAIGEKAGEFKGFVIPNYAIGFGKAMRSPSAGFIGEPGTYKVTTTIENNQMVEAWLSECIVKTNWVDYERIVENRKNNIVITDLLTIKKRMMTQDEAESPFFADDVVDFAACDSKEAVFLELNIQNTSKNMSATAKSAADLLGPPLEQMTFDQAKKLLNTGSDVVLNKLLTFTRMKLAANPNDIDVLVMRARLLNWRAKFYSKTKNMNYLNSALALIEKANTLNKSVYSDQIADEKFRIFLKMDRFDDAQLVLKEIQSNSKGDLLKFDLTNMYYETIGKYDEVEKNIKAYLAELKLKKMNDPYVESQLISILRKQDKHSEAVVSANEYIARNPKATWERFALADSLYHLKEYAKSSAILKQWVQVFPSHAEGKKLLSSVILEEALLKQGDTIENKVAFAQYKKLPEFEAQLMESLKWDERNEDTLKILVALNDYLFALKKDALYKSKTDLYGSQLAQVRALKASIAAPAAARMPASTGK